jgi:hypothetical protein
MSKRILLLDLDTPIFASSAVSETKSVLVTHRPTGKQKVFKNRKEFKELLKQKEKLDKLSEYSIEDKQEAQPIENACHTLKMMIGRVIEDVQADEVMYFISGENNFRDSLPLPIKYKSGRSDTIRPLLLKDVKKFATKKYNAEICHGDEPDDRIIYRSYELKDKGCTPIVATIDKDALAYSGILLYNQDKPKQGIIEIPQLGSLWIDENKKVRGVGFLWFCHQMLIGDQTDTYRPTDLCKIQFGEKSSYKLLENCKTEKEALEVVIQQYEKWYPDEFEYTAWDGNNHKVTYKDILLLYFRCVRMKSNEFDELNFFEFCQTYGVNLNER